MLLRDTVFNAPGSHFAAIFGITGLGYTLVGDGAVGVLAIKVAHDLLENQALDFCLVVGEEEADWLLCDAYHKWRLLKKQPPIELFADPPRGMILSEGAGAVLLSREGTVEIDAIDAGGNFSHRHEANEILRRVMQELAAEHACIIASANGTFIDLAEREAIKGEQSKATVYSLKAALGESVGASAIWQMIAGAQALRSKRLPEIAHSNPNAALNFSKSDELSCKKAIVLSCGLNQQAAGARLSI